MSEQAAGDPHRCPQCGTEFQPESSPLGVCPACLIKLGASDPAWKIPRPDPVQHDAPVATVDDRVAVPAPSRPRVVPAIWAGAVAVALAVLLMFVVFRTVPSSPAPAGVVRFDLALPEDVALRAGAQFAVSPDGTHVVAAARNREGRERLWLRPLESLDWRELGRTDGAAFPFWSPDSRHIAFFADRKLKRIEVTNWLVDTLAGVGLGLGGTWGRRDVIVFADAGQGLMRVPAAGGTPVAILPVDQARRERFHAWPSFLPDGERFLFVSVLAGEKHTTELSMASIDSHQRKLILQGTGAALFADGALVFERNGGLVVRRFDPERGELRDDAQPVSGSEKVGMTANSGPAFSVSQNGVLIHTSGAAQRSQLTWVDRTGRVMDTLGPPAEYRGVSVSPDGRRLAVARRDTSDSESQVSIVALDRNTVVRVTRAEARSEYPIWSPDGGRLVYVANETELHAVDVTTLKDETVLPTPDAKRPLDWSPDGRLLLYSTQRADGGAGLHALQVAGDRKPDALGRASFNETDARFSPDGRWIAYVSDETGTDEVYVRQFPEPGGQWPVTSGGGTRPRWRRDGRELYFMLPGGVIGSADIASGPSLAVGTPRPLFAIGSASDYEPFSDGHRFIVTRPARDTARDAIVAVLNWRSGLRSGSTIR